MNESVITCIDLALAVDLNASFILSISSPDFFIYIFFQLFCSDPHLWYVYLLACESAFRFWSAQSTINPSILPPVFKWIDEEVLLRIFLYPITFLSFRFCLRPCYTISFRSLRVNCSIFSRSASILFMPDWADVFWVLFYWIRFSGCHSPVAFAPR